jgi:hypothetical protein
MLFSARFQEGHSSEVLVFGKHNPNPAMNRAATALLLKRVGGSRRFWDGFASR